jgi:hypothetical protein
VVVFGCESNVQDFGVRDIAVVELFFFTDARHFPQGTETCKGQRASLLTTFSAESTIAETVTVLITLLKYRKAVQ